MIVSLRKGQRGRAREARGDRTSASAEAGRDHGVLKCAIGAPASRRSPSGGTGRRGRRTGVLPGNCPVPTRLRRRRRARSTRARYKPPQLERAAVSAPRRDAPPSTAGAGAPLAAMRRNCGATAVLSPPGASKIPGVQKSSGKRSQHANSLSSSPSLAWQSAWNISPKPRSSHSSGIIRSLRSKSSSALSYSPRWRQDFGTRRNIAVGVRHLTPVDLVHVVERSRRAREGHPSEMTPAIGVDGCSGSRQPFLAVSSIARRIGSTNTVQRRHFVRRRLVLSANAPRATTLSALTALSLKRRRRP